MTDSTVATPKFTLIKHENLFTYADMLTTGMEYFRKDAIEYVSVNEAAKKEQGTWQDCAAAYVTSVTDSGAYAALLNYEVDSDGKPIKIDGATIPKDGLASATIKRYTDKAANTIIAMLNGDDPESLDAGNEKGIALLEQKFGVKKSNRAGTGKKSMTAKEMKAAIKALFEDRTRIADDDAPDWEAFADTFAEKFETLNPSK